MKWTLECTRMGERDATYVGTFDSPEAAVAEAERRSPRGIHWTVIGVHRIGVAGDCQYAIKQESVREKSPAT